MFTLCPTSCAIRFSAMLTAPQAATTWGWAALQILQRGDTPFAELQVGMRSQPLKIVEADPQPQFLFGHDQARIATAGLRQQVLQGLGPGRQAGHGQGQRTEPPARGGAGPGRAAMA
jgi:hypothetical protein